MTPTTQQWDAKWTYIGQSTWMLQIGYDRYLVRSTYRSSGLDGGVGLSLLVVEGSNILQFLTKDS